MENGRPWERTPDAKSKSLPAPYGFNQKTCLVRGSRSGSFNRCRGRVTDASRRGALLAITLVTMLLLLSVVAPLVAATASTAFTANACLDELQHELAVESLIGLLPAIIQNSDGLDAGSGLANSLKGTLTIGSREVVAYALQDESAKLRVKWLAALGPDKCEMAIERLCAAAGINGIHVRKNGFPAEAAILEDLLERADDGELYGTDDEVAGLYRFVTIASGPIDVGRAPPVVLDVLSLAPPRPDPPGRRRNNEESQSRVLRPSTGGTARASQQRTSGASNGATAYSLVVRTSHGRRTLRSYLVVDATARDVVGTWRISP